MIIDGSSFKMSTVGVLLMGLSFQVFHLIGSAEHVERPPVNRLLVMTVANDPGHEGFRRFNRSIQAYGLELSVLGANEVVSADGQVPSKRSGRQVSHIELLRKALSSYRKEPHLVILLADSNQLIVNGNKRDILERFNKAKPATRILITADSRCWPNRSLAAEYPPLAGSNGGQRFLNSRALIGFASHLYDLLSLEESDRRIFSSAEELQNAQLYYTRAYLQPEIRHRLAIELDHKSELFQSLDQIERDLSDTGDGQKQPRVELEFDLDSVRLKNLAYGTEPLVVHGGHSSKVTLDSLGNYLGKAWTVRDGCRYCNESMISLASLKDSEMPKVLVGLFIEEPTPFLGGFFADLAGLNYPRKRMHLLVHTSIQYHDRQLEEFLSQVGSEYGSKVVLKSYSETTLASQLDEWQARERALDRCIELECDYYLALDSLARLDWQDSLRALIEVNRTVVAPLLSRPTKLWSNFWGSISEDGYYARSHDYVALVRRERLGLWNVAMLTNAYLIKGHFIKNHRPTNRSSEDTKETSDSPKRGWLSYKSQLETLAGQWWQSEPALTGGAGPQQLRKPALVFGHNLRALGVHQILVNSHEFGHLVDPSNYNTSLLHPDLYQLEENPYEWEQQYLHENYSSIFEPDNADNNETVEESAPTQQKNSSNSTGGHKQTTASANSLGASLGSLEQPCPDVFWFPLVSDLFSSQLIEVMESYGLWSGGSNDDPRIEGGYESVPTRDIHLRQVGLHEMWLLFLRDYVMPVQLREFQGYEHDPPRAELAFVVRYHPREQASLRAHHDSSTYTLNIALNEPGPSETGYSGGGCRFIRYKCSVTQSRRGWALMHPGRLTHYHEGLPVTSGTRYIMVTFVDP